MLVFPCSLETSVELRVKPMSKHLANVSAVLFFEQVPNLTHLNEVVFIFEQLKQVVVGFLQLGCHAPYSTHCFGLSVPKKMSLILSAHFRDIFVNSSHSIKKREALNSFLFNL